MSLENSLKDIFHTTRWRAAVSGLGEYNGNTVKIWAGNSQWRACRADWARFRKAGCTAWGSEGFWALVLHRLQKVVRQRRPAWLWAPARLALQVIRKLFVMMTLIDIHPDAEIGPALVIPHGGPIRVHAATKIGADCALHHMSKLALDLDRVEQR